MTLSQVVLLYQCPPSPRYYILPPIVIHQTLANPLLVGLILLYYILSPITNHDTSDPSESPTGRTDSIILYCILPPITNRDTSDPSESPTGRTDSIMDEQTLMLTWHVFRELHTAVS